MDKIKFGGKEYLVKYIHRRRPKTIGEVEGINFVPSERGGTTTARITIESDILDYIEGVAKCSNLDNFSKKRGRTIALGRLKKRVAIFKETRNYKENFSAQLTR